MTKPKKQSSVFGLYGAFAMVGLIAAPSFAAPSIAGHDVSPKLAMVVTERAPAVTRQKESGELLDCAQECFANCDFAQGARYAELAQNEIVRNDPFALETNELESSLYLQALCFQKLHQNNRAIELYEKGIALSQRENRLHETHWLEMLAETYAAAKDDTGCARAYERAFDVLDNSDVNDRAYEVYLLSKVASAYQNAGSLAQAESAWRHAVRISEKSVAVSAPASVTRAQELPPTVADLSDALCGLALNLAEQGKIQVADGVFNRAVALVEPYDDLDCFSAKQRTFRLYANYLRKNGQVKTASEFEKKARRAERLEAKAGW